LYFPHITFKVNRAIIAERKTISFDENSLSVEVTIEYMDKSGADSDNFESVLIKSDDVEKTIFLSFSK
jgi:hypothetical protein